MQFCPLRIYSINGAFVFVACAAVVVHHLFAKRQYRFGSTLAYMAFGIWINERSVSIFRQAQHIDRRCFGPLQITQIDWAH